MERLITVKDMRERYGCTGATARKYIRQFPMFYESPLTAPEWALVEWENSRERSQPGFRQTAHRAQTGRVIVPRRRKGK